MVSSWRAKVDHARGKQDQIYDAMKVVKQIAITAALHEMTYQVRRRKAFDKLCALNSLIIKERIFKEFHSHAKKMHALKKACKEWESYKSLSIMKQLFFYWIKSKYKLNSIKAAISVHERILKKKTLRVLLRNALDKITAEENQEKAMLLHCFHINKVAFDSLRLFAQQQARKHKIENELKEMKARRMKQDSRDIVKYWRNAAKDSKKKKTLSSNATKIYRKMKAKLFIKDLAQSVLNRYSKNENESKSRNHYQSGLLTKSFNSITIYKNISLKNKVLTEMVSTYQTEKTTNTLREAIDFINCFSAVSSNIRASAQLAQEKITQLRKTNAFKDFISIVKEAKYMETMSLKLLQCHGQKCSEKIIFKAFKLWKQWVISSKETKAYMQEAEETASKYYSNHTLKKTMIGWAHFSQYLKNKLQKEKMIKIMRDWRHYAKQRHDLVKYLKEGKMDTMQGLVTPKNIHSDLTE